MADDTVKLENEAAQSTNALGPLIGVAREDFVSAVALLLRETEQYAEAEPWIREALDIWEAIGRDHPEKAVLLNNYGSVLRNLGRLGEVPTVELRATDLGRAWRYGEW